MSFVHSKYIKKISLFKTYETVFLVPRFNQQFRHEKSKCQHGLYKIVWYQSNDVTSYLYSYIYNIVRYCRSHHYQNQYCFLFLSSIWSFCTRVYACDLVISLCDLSEIILNLCTEWLRYRVLVLNGTESGAWFVNNVIVVPPSYRRSHR